jgi:hypothetical protein
LNHLATRRPGVAIASTPPSEPLLPPAVAHAVSAHLAPVIGARQFGEDDPGHYVAPPLVSPADWRAAQEAADQFDAMLAPITAEVLAAWLMPVNAASRNPQSPQDFALRVAGIAEMVGDLPAAAFTAETRRNLATGFFPSHEDIRAAVEPVADAWRRKRNALRSLRQSEPRPAPEVGAIAPAERQAAVERARAIAAELRSAAAQRRPEPVKAAPLRPAELIAAYEAEAAKGNTVAAARLEILRREAGQ